MPWTAETASPVIHLSWHGQRRIASLIVRPAPGLPSTPLTVKVTSPDGTRQASIGPGGLVRFTAPLTTDRMDVSFPRVRQATIITSTGQLETLPVRLSQLSVPALAGLRAVTPITGQRSSALACGRGPALTVDGRVYQTSVSGTIGELSQYLPLPVRLCTPGGTLSLGAGRHTLTAATPGTFAVTDLTLTSARGRVRRPGPSGAPGAVTIRSWQPDQRLVGIGPGATSYLEVHENYNPGWAATLNGQQLTPVRLDGWQQAFIAPGGAGGTVTLTFRPAGTYHLVLVGSILAAALLLAIVAWSFIGRTPASQRAAALTGPGSDEGATTKGRLKSGPEASVRYSLLAVTALIFVAGGPVALAVPLLACLAWLPPRTRGRAIDPAARLPLIALPALVVSGLLSAVRPFGDGPVRSVRLASASVRARGAGRRADAGDGRPGLALAPSQRRRRRLGRKGSGPMSAAPYAGISLALLATTAYNVGLIQEKRALGRMPALDVRRVPRLITSLLTDPAWLAGFALMLLGLACQTIVLTFEPVSVVQPVLASGVALVLVLSRLVLRERLGAVEFWCVAAMAVCVILLAASTGGTDTGAGHHASPGWMAAVAIPSVVIGLLVAASPLRSRCRADRGPDAAVCFGIGTGLLYGVAALAIKALSGILAAQPRTLRAS